MISRLPLGLTMVPRVFLQIMRPIKVCICLREVQVNSFLDDFLILAITSAMCTIHTALTEKLLICLGFEINYQKPSLILYQSLEYLSILRNLRDLTFSLPSDKVSMILSFCQQLSTLLKMTQRELEALVDLLRCHPLWLLAQSSLVKEQELLTSA